MEYGLVALWLGMYLLLLAVAAPVAAALFPRLADRGAGVALPLAAAVLWLVGYWVGHRSLGLASWVGPALLVAVAVAVAVRYRPTVDVRIVGETAAVFTAAFLLLVAVRAVDPAVHPLGGEKFLDFGLLRSLLRAEALPPEDMWFAGEPVSYYYGGHLLASVFARLTGTAPRFAYNLALAGFYGMVLTAAYGLAGSVAAGRGVSRRLAGVLGVFFVGFASNLSTPIRGLVWLLPAEQGAALAGASGVGVEGLAAGPDGFSYWDASRVIEGTINEFPLFAWLNGDLHAHMMSTPFLLLAAAVCLAYVQTPQASLRRRRLLVFGLLPPLAGLLAVVNTWSFPTVGGLAALSLLFAPSDPWTLAPGRLWSGADPDGHRLGAEAGRTAAALAAGATVVLVGVVWSAPFWFGTASTRSVGVLPARSALAGLLVVHGGFLFVFVPYLARQVGSALTETRLAAVTTLVVVAGGLLADAPGVSLFSPLIGLGWVTLRAAGRRRSAVEGEPAPVASADGGTAATGPERDGPGFEAVLLVAGAGLALLVELVFIREQAGPGRLNTVFKTYMQVWVLWGVAAGVALADLCRRSRPSVALGGRRWRAAFSVLAVLLLVSTGVYGALALSGHFEGGYYGRPDDPTLNATVFVETGHPEEAGAIAWLDDREGRPHIVSAPGSYRWDPEQGAGASAAASLTGLPTVLGWHHEVGYRGQAAYDRRAAHVETMYTGEPADQRRLLARYDVEYVYVSRTEVNVYGELTVDDLRGVEPARSWESVVVYRVTAAAKNESAVEEPGSRPGSE